MAIDYVQEQRGTKDFTPQSRTRPPGSLEIYQNKGRGSSCLMGSRRQKGFLTHNAITPSLSLAKPILLAHLPILPPSPAPRPSFQPLGTLRNLPESSTYIQHFH